MASKLTKGLRPTHPGEILREDVLPALDITKTRFAELLHVSRQTLYDLLGEKQPVTPQMALRLGVCSATARRFGSGCRVRTTWLPRRRYLHRNWSRYGRLSWLDPQCLSARHVGRIQARGKNPQCQAPEDSGG
jgi:antitoxin HigA-1